MSDTMIGDTQGTNDATPPPAAVTESPKKKGKHGGVRPGGGRPPGSANKIKGAVLRKMYASASIELESKDPADAIKEFLEKVLRHNGIDIAIRMSAARELAPYVMSKAPTLNVTAEASLSAQHLEAVANMGRGSNAKTIAPKKAKAGPSASDITPATNAQAAI
jgi:hypothetical protein